MAEQGSTAADWALILYIQINEIKKKTFKIIFIFPELIENVENDIYIY
jgi:hypothetical protein